MSIKDTSYKNYLLTVLLTTLAFNYVDRLTLGLVLQDIKVDLALSDTQLGTLSGIAFALFYSIMGIPIARWADRGNRVTIIGTATALWSVAVALCGLAVTFVQLVVIRVAVAVGEAGCIPPAHSLIADHFTRAQRPRAIGIYMLGAPLSVVIGYFFGGWLNEFYGWRVTFVLLGLPGLALAGLVWLTLREPRRGKIVHDAGAQSSMRSLASPLASEPTSVPPSLAEVCATLWGIRTFRHLLFCFAVVSFFAFGVTQWKPTFFIRTFGLGTGELGTWLTVIYGLGGLLGTYWGGEWASRFAANNERLQLKVMAIVYVSFSLLSACMYLSTNRYLAFILLAITTLGGATVSGPLFATIQTLVPQRMRAVSIAFIYLFSNLVGMGLGPLATGALSDALRPLFGDDSLRYALLALCPGYVWGGWYLWRASTTVTGDMAKAEAAAKENDAKSVDPVRSSPHSPTAADSGRMRDIA